MSLDVYVMPIWRFKAGDFRSPVEALIGIAPIIYGPDGINRSKRATRPRIFTKWKAKRDTRKLRREIEREAGHSVKWNDDGEIEYTQQSYGFESLRAFAKWLDYRDMFPTFDAPPEQNYHKHPVMSQKLVRPLTYPQLVSHDCYSGYFIPTEIDQVVYVEPFRSWGDFVFKRSVGSSAKLLAELSQLSKILQIDEPREWRADDPLSYVKVAFVQLFEVAKISCRYQLPIVFYG